MGILSIKKMWQSSSRLGSGSGPEAPPAEGEGGAPAGPGLGLPPPPAGPGLGAPPPPPPSKALPQELYRRLLPAGLFLLTFLTVMAMLLIYMDTTAMVTQQFRVNMSRDYELPAVAQDDPNLVAYVRQWHLTSDPTHHRTHHAHHIDLLATDSDGLPIDEKAQFIYKMTSYKRNGTFVEALMVGAPSPTTLWLERTSGWRGLRVRADPRDFLTLRPNASPTTPALHACLSTVPHPKEISYREPWHNRGMGENGNSIVGGTGDVSVHAVLGGEDEWFSPRVKCFPLLTLLLAVNATKCDYLILGAGGSELNVLKTLPFEILHIHIIEVIQPADSDSTALTAFLQSHGYRPRLTDDTTTVYVKSPYPPVLKI